MNFVKDIIILTSVIYTCQLQSKESESELKDKVHLHTNKPLGYGFAKFSVKEVSDFLSAKEFFTEYVYPQKPLVIRGGARISPAFHKWTDDYLLNLSIPTNETIEVELNKKEVREDGVKQMHLHDYLRQYNSSDIYMVQDVPSYLMSDVRVPCILQCPELTFMTTVMWMSSGGTKSVLHTDDVDNLNCLYRGRKELLLIDRKQAKFCHLNKGDHSTLDVDSIDYKLYPGLANVQYYQVFMKEGDCLFIPYRWVHQVRSFNSNLAVNLWWNHDRGENVNLTSCDTVCRINKSLSDLIFTHADEQENFETIDVKSRCLELLNSDNSVPLAELVQYMTKFSGIDPGSDEADYNNFQNDITAIFKTLDYNNNNKLEFDEIESIPPDKWQLLADHLNDSPESGKKNPYAKTEL